MANEWDDRADDDGQQNSQNQNQGGALRKQLEAALAANKTQAEELSKLKAQVRSTAIGKVLETKNVSAKVAKLVPADVEPTPEAVEKWLEEFGDVFGVKPDDSTGGDDSGSGDAAADEAARQAYIQNARQMGAVTAGALPPGKENELIQKISDPNMTYEGLLELIAQHGGGPGSG